MMSLEQPLIAAVIARLPNPVENLAAFGLTFSLALIVESPVIMLFTAGTALATNRQRYNVLLRFTALLAGSLGVLHLVVVLTPAYRLLIGGVVGAPAEVVDLGRMAFLLMLAWTPAIAFRRLWQGVLIRHGSPGRVGATTVFRLAATALVCAIGLTTAGLAGSALGGLALSIGVTVAAIAAYVLARPTIAGPLGLRGDQSRPLARAELLEFYVPLALTSFIILGANPLINLALGRAPDALRSLAVWPVVTGSLFIVRSTAYAYQEVVVALVDEPAGREALARFLGALAGLLTAIMAVAALSPLATFWFSSVAGLTPHLLAAARPALVSVLLVPGLSALIAWYRGLLVSADRTPVITQAVVVNLLVLGVTLLAGLVLVGPWLGGATVAGGCLTLSLLAEVGWLRVRQG